MSDAPLVSSPRPIALVLTAPPLPFGNAAARWYYVLWRGLVERGHAVQALIPCADDSEVEAVHQMFAAPEFRFTCFPYWDRRGIKARWESLRRPSSYLYHDDLRTAVGRAMQDPATILHLEHNWSGWLGTNHVDRAVLAMHSLYTVDLTTNSLDSITRRWAESRLLAPYRLITAVTPELTKRIQQMAPEATVHTVPLGLDTSLYQFSPKASAGANPVVGLIGSFNWEPSLLAAKRLITSLWPEIKKRRPDARLLVVGREAKSALAAFLTRDLEVQENVPDISRYFQEIDVMLYAPERGSGMKVKVLEAFAYGTPVVTNSSGAEGIPIVDGVHAGFAESDADLVARAVQLLTDPELRSRYQSAARTLVEEHCRPDTQIDRLQEMYSRCA